MLIEVSFYWKFLNDGDVLLSQKIVIVYFYVQNVPALFNENKPTDLKNLVEKQPLNSEWLLSEQNEGQFWTWIRTLTPL